MLQGHPGVDFEVFRDILDVVLDAGLIGRIVNNGFLVHDVDDARELVLRTDGNANRVRLGTELGSQVVEGLVEVGTGAIHLVDERDPGDVVLGGLPPDGLGLGLHAGHTTENSHRTVKYAHRAFHLRGEVHVAGGVDDVDAMVNPRE